MVEGIPKGRKALAKSISSQKLTTTKWADAPDKTKTLGNNTLSTIISGHLTPEQIDAYQEYFRIEEISDILRKAHESHEPILSFLSSNDETKNPTYEREPSPPPKFDKEGKRINTREQRTKLQLEKERHFLVEVAAGSIKNYVAPPGYVKPVKTFEKLYIPVKDYPEINFVGLLLGPRGKTLKTLQEDSGARLQIRGKGSVKSGRSANPGEDDDQADDDLHVLITSDTQSKIAKAIKLTNEVLDKAISSPIGQNDLKRDQLRELAVLNGTLRETKPFNPDNNSQGRPRRNDSQQIVCKICQRPGHLSKDCKQGQGQSQTREPIQRKRPTESRAHQEVIPPFKRGRAPTKGPAPMAPPPPPPAAQASAPPPPPPPISTRPSYARGPPPPPPPPI
ncbi:hypothetical protein DFJ63DRAFT_88091 [Scheffersomyces coipomensis]|uniref:uncharacterized protein n=1 Tax=Scheffersomyces coipomensis TaxID=1788519 RepID=UPI00315CF109